MALFNGFELSARPFIDRAYCKCGQELKEVSNGFFSFAMFCKKCHNAYELKLVKYAKKRLNKDWIRQSLEEIDRKTKEKI